MWKHATADSRKVGRFSANENWGGGSTPQGPDSRKVGRFSANENWRDGSTPQSPDSGKVGRCSTRTKKLRRRTVQAAETPSHGSESIFAAKVVGFE